jgi:uncharacterized DUF497 family protein
MDPDDLFAGCTGFDWDAGNIDKNWDKHGVGFWEAEEVFFNQPLLLEADVAHSKDEKRFYCLGITDAGRKLFVVFTIRGHLIRVISARDMTRRERNTYEKLEEENPSLQK